MDNDVVNEGFESGGGRVCASLGEAGDPMAFASPGLKVTFLGPLLRGGAERGAGGISGVDSAAGDAMIE